MLAVVECGSVVLVEVNEYQDVVWRPRQAKALMASKEQNELLFGGQEHVKTRWALSFFFDGLQRAV